MKIINEQLLDETQAKALQSPRLRMTIISMRDWMIRSIGY